MSLSTNDADHFDMYVMYTCMYLPIWYTNTSDNDLFLIFHVDHIMLSVKLSAHLLEEISQQDPNSHITKHYQILPDQPKKIQLVRSSLASVLSSLHRQFSPVLSSLATATPKKN